MAQKPRPILSLSQLKTRIYDAYSHARLYRWSHDQLMQALDKAYRDELKTTTGKIKPKRRYSPYVEGFCSGLIQACSDELYRHQLEFCYLVEGVLFSTHMSSVHRKTEEFYKAGRGSELGKSFSGHYWKGTDRLFFGSFPK